MLVKTEIKWISVIFAALLAALAGYQSFVAHRILSLNQALSQKGFRSAFTCLDLLRLQSQAEENSRRWPGVAGRDFLG